MFQHINLYKYVFTQEQENGLLIESRKFELPSLEILPLSDARTAESVMEEEEEERQRIANIDTFNSEIGLFFIRINTILLDIFESLSPEEIKKVTTETVLSLIEHFKQETENILSDQKVKTQINYQKNIKE